MMRNRHAVIAAILSLFLCWPLSSTVSGKLQAEEAESRDLRMLEIEELMTIEVQTVSSTSHYQQKVTEAPSSVTVVTSEDIRRYGYRTLADLLRCVRGFSTAFDRNYTSLGVRGFGRPGDDNSRVLLLVDGHRLNDTIYDSAMLGTEFILDIDLIERVEISRGPGSSLYGNNAFFAVVNVVTRKAKDFGGTELSGEAGSFETVKGRASFGGRGRNGLETVLSASGYSSKGDRHYFRQYDQRLPFADVRAGNNGIAEDVDHDRFQSGYARMAARGLTITGAFANRTKDVPTASSGADFNDPGNRTTDRRSYIDAGYSRGLGKRTDLSLRFYHDYYRSTGDYLYAGTANQDGSYGTWQGGEARLSTTAFRDHHLILGTEYRGNQHQDQWNADREPYRLYLDDRRRSRVWAAYLQDEVRISPAVLVNAGLRYDHTSTFGGTTNPRLALIASPFDQTAVKLLYGSAYRAPNVYELYYQSPTSVPPLLANPSLVPEKIKTYELVYEQYFGRNVRASLSGYYYTISNLIIQTTDTTGSSVFQNLSEANGKGLELEFHKQWSSGISASGGYTQQRAYDARTDTVLANSPKQLATLAVSVPFWNERTVVSLAGQYTGKRRTLSGSTVQDYFLPNLTALVRNSSRTVEASLSIYNLFDTKYRDPVSAGLFPLYSVQQDGRTVRVKLTYAF